MTRQAEAGRWRRRPNKSEPSGALSSFRPSVDRYTLDDDGTIARDTLIAKCTFRALK